MTRATALAKEVKLPAMKRSILAIQASKVEHVRSNRFFQSRVLTNKSSSGLNNETLLSEASRIVLRLARLLASDQQAQRFP
jgi:hypothetical protein